MRLRGRSGSWPRASAQAIASRRARIRSASGRPVRRACLRNPRRGWRPPGWHRRPALRGGPRRTGHVTRPGPVMLMRAVGAAYAVAETSGPRVHGRPPPPASLPVNSRYACRRRPWSPEASSRCRGTYELARTAHRGRVEGLDHGPSSASRIGSASSGMDPAGRGVMPHPGGRGRASGWLVAEAGLAPTSSWSREASRMAPASAACVPDVSGSAVTAPVATVLVSRLPEVGAAGGGRRPRVMAGITVVVPAGGPLRGTVTPDVSPDGRRSRGPPLQDGGATVGVPCPAGRLR
ncbi:hypothetical protein SALBM217S_05553 [Streptomyces griseoloalbus]